MYAFTAFVDAKFYKEKDMQELRSVLEKHGFHFKKQFPVRVFGRRND